MIEEEFWGRQIEPRDMEGKTVYQKAAIYYIKDLNPEKTDCQNDFALKKFTKEMEDLDNKLTALKRAKYRG